MPIYIQRDRYRLRVRAIDKGNAGMYAEVDIELDVVDRNNKPPIWDLELYGPIHIKENVTVGTVVTSLKARFVSIDRNAVEKKNKIKCDEFVDGRASRSTGARGWGDNNRGNHTTPRTLAKPIKEVHATRPHSICSMFVSNWFSDLRLLY